MQALRDAAAWLAAIHPALPWALIPLALWLTTYATRRWLPSAWVKLDAWMLPIGKPASNFVLSLPSVAAGALAGVYLMGGGDYGQAVLGALAGVLAPLWHHFLKALPVVPYDGAAAKVLAAKSEDA